jgi:hypothetical protein
MEVVMSLANIKTRREKKEDDDGEEDRKKDGKTNTSFQIFVNIVKDK